MCINYPREREKEKKTERTWCKGNLYGPPSTFAKSHYIFLLYSLYFNVSYIINRVYTVNRARMRFFAAIYTHEFLNMFVFFYTPFIRTCVAANFKNFRLWIYGEKVREVMRMKERSERGMKRLANRVPKLYRPPNITDDVRRLVLIPAHWSHTLEYIRVCKYVYTTHGSLYFLFLESTLSSSLLSFSFSLSGFSSFRHTRHGS